MAYGPVAPVEFEMPVLKGSGVLGVFFAAGVATSAGAVAFAFAAAGLVEFIADGAGATAAGV